MPLLFGTWGQDSPRAQTDIPVAAEHVDEQLESVRHERSSAGVWRSPSVASEDAVYSGLIDGESVICVCDAEITNRDELCSKTGELRSHGPNAGIARLIALLVSRNGAAAFKELRGGFACAVVSSRQAYLAVDRFGTKRLAYSATPKRLSFSSRVTALLGEDRISPIAIAHYLNLSYIPAPETILENCKKLQPGCCLHWQLEKEPQVTRYWELSFPEDLRASENELGSQLSDFLEGAVTEALSGVKLEKSGCFLSGGTDSSSIVGMTGRVSSRALPSYTVVFDDDDFSELTYARIAANHFGSDLRQFPLRPDDAWSALPKLIRAFDEPFGNPSALGGYHCAVNARQMGTELLLAGDGGDELFGGNERYRKDVIYSWINALPNIAIDNVVWNSIFAITRTSGISNRVRNILKRATLQNPERFFLEDSLTSELNGDFWTPELSQATHTRNALEIVREYYEAAPANSELNKLLFVDLKMTIGDNDLVKVRQTASAAGVRVRFPMLDHPLAQFSGRIPANLKVKGLEKRYIFKHALRDFLPREVIKKKKHGFGVPVSTWFRSEPRFRELLLDVTNDRVTLQRGYFRKDRLHQIVDEHLRSFRDWGQTLWAILMLELWQREAERG